MRAFAAVPIIALVLLGGCVKEEEFVGDSGFHAFAMTEATPPIFVGERGSLYLLESRFEFPITPPTDEEMAELTAAGATQAFARWPWVEVDDLVIEVDVAVKNLTAEPRDVTVQINGFNEFDEYTPGFLEVNMNAVPQYSQWERTFRMEPNEVWQRTIHQREIREIAVDLATVVNGAPNSEQVVYFENQSGIDPRIDSYIPSDVIAGLTGFRFGLRTTAAANVVLEASVRIRDEGDRLWQEGDEALEPWVLPVPAPFVPLTGYEPP